MSDVRCESFRMDIDIIVAVLFYLLTSIPILDLGSSGELFLDLLRDSFFLFFPVVQHQNRRKKLILRSETEL